MFLLHWLRLISSRPIIVECLCSRTSNLNGWRSMPRMTRSRRRRLPACCTFHVEFWEELWPTLVCHPLLWLSLPHCQLALLISKSSPFNVMNTSVHVYQMAITTKKEYCLAIYVLCFDFLYYVLFMLIYVFSVIMMVIIPQFSCNHDRCLYHNTTTVAIFMHVQLAG
jgi:hypothetical protein